MEENVVEILRTLWSVIPGQTEFWSAIFGAVVGGSIAYMIQLKALREGRKQRDEDHNRLQQALGNALLFKMIRVHSNFYGVHKYIEGCFVEAARREHKGEPWQAQSLTRNPDIMERTIADLEGATQALNNFAQSAELTTETADGLHWLALQIDGIMVELRNRWDEMHPVTAERG